MTTSLPSKLQLTQNVEHDTLACQRLLELLDAERTALTERDLDGLDDIIKEKANHLSQLEIGANQRTVWLNAQTQGSEMDLGTQWEQLLNSVAPQLKTQWHTFKTLLDQCQTENEINGKLLARNRQVFSRIVALLRGQGDSTDTYSSASGKNKSQSGHYLGEA